MRTFTLRIIVLVALLASCIAGYSAPPSVNLGNDTLICDDGSFITLDAGFFPGATYLWEDGSTDQTHVVYGGGIYSVTVDVAGEIGYDEIEVGFLTPATNVQFSWVPTGTCLPITVNFTDESTTTCTSILAWDWDFGDGSTGTGPNPSHVYNVAGPQNVKLTITNSQGDQTVRTYLVDYSPMAVVPFDLGADTAICPGGSVLLTAPSAPALPGGTIYTYLWSTGATTQSISANATGTYSVVVSNNWGCDASDSREVTADPGPVVALGNDTTICSIDALTLDAGNPGSTYLWESGETTQTLYVDFPGTYSVIVTSPGGCVAKDTLELNMLPSLYADFSFTQSGTCLPVTADIHRQQHQVRSYYRLLGLGFW